MGLLGYIDPVSGMLVLQGLIAGIVGIVAFFRRSIWAVCHRVFGDGKSGDDRPPEP